MKELRLLRQKLNILVSEDSFLVLRTEEPYLADPMVRLVMKADGVSETQPRWPNA